MIIPPPTMTVRMDALTLSSSLPGTAYRENGAARYRAKASAIASPRTPRPSSSASREMSSAGAILMHSPARPRRARHSPSARRICSFTSPVRARDLHAAMSARMSPPHAVRQYSRISGTSSPYSP